MGQTGIALATSTGAPDVNPALTLALRPDSQPLNTQLLPMATVTSITTSYDPLQWTDARRAIAMYLGSSSSPEWTTFSAPRTVPMFAAPSGGLTVTLRPTR
jgi:hypothetical protein